MLPYSRGRDVSICKELKKKQGIPNRPNILFMCTFGRHFDIYFKKVERKQNKYHKLELNVNAHTIKNLLIVKKLFNF